MGFYATTTECTCREKMHPPSKNRVWGFSATSRNRAWKSTSQVLEPQQENQPTPTTTASGVHYYGLRYYNPELGRWVNRDPIEEEGGIHIYAMTHNDAVNVVDVLGERWWLNPLYAPPGGPGPALPGWGVVVMALLGPLMDNVVDGVLSGMATCDQPCDTASECLSCCRNHATAGLIAATAGAASGHASCVLATTGRIWLLGPCWAMVALAHNNASDAIIAAQSDCESGCLDNPQ